MVDTLFLALDKYEKEGVDGMDWAEWAANDLEENIVSKLTRSDWEEIEDHIPDKSDHFKSLLISVIRLDDAALADVQLRILRNFVLHEQVDVAFDALQKITFGFVTSGRDYETDTTFHKQELKGVFSGSERERLIVTYFDDAFRERATAIALECSEFFKDGIQEFLKLISAEGNS